MFIGFVYSTMAIPYQCRKKTSNKLPSGLARSSELIFNFGQIWTGVFEAADLVQLVHCLLCPLAVDGHGDLLARVVALQLTHELGLALFQKWSVELEL